MRSPRSTRLLQQLDTHPRWRRELSPVARLALSAEALEWEWYGAGVCFAAALAGAVCWAVPGLGGLLWVTPPAMGVLLLFFLPRAMDRTDARPDRREVCAGLWQLGARFPQRYLRRHPARLKAYRALSHAAGAGSGDRLAAHAVGLLAFCIEDWGTLGRIKDIASDRGLADPAELVRLAAVSEDCLPVSEGLL